MKFLDITKSGSEGGITASRNHYGQYYRRRAIPVNPSTSYQGVVRDRLANAAASWRSITANQRAGWTDLALQINKSDSLGQSHSMKGFNCYSMVNVNRLTAGDAVLTDAPLLVTPAPPTTVTVTLTSAALSVAYTTTPLAAGQRLFSYLSGNTSAGRSFNKNVKLIAVSAAAAASPANLFAAFSVRNGVPVTGSLVFMVFRIYQGGFLSGPLELSQVVA